MSSNSQLNLRETRFLWNELVLLGKSGGDGDIKTKRGELVNFLRNGRYNELSPEQKVALREIERLNPEKLHIFTL